jgi:broad specificity phosphatase PhoE
MRAATETKNSTLETQNCASSRLTLVRHGETEGESSIRYHGATDVALNALGLEQMRRVASVLAGEQFDLVYTSKLRRTTEAAAIIAPRLPVQAIEGFNEINFGSWEGLTAEEIQKLDPTVYEEWRLRSDDFKYPSGDSVTEFRGRIVATFNQLLSEMPQRALIVAHKGVIRSIVAELLALSAEEHHRWPIDLASIHVLSSAGGVWRAEVINRTDHLLNLSHDE